MDLAHKNEAHIDGSLAEDPYTFIHSNNSITHSAAAQRI
jgi:hypothetical protein